MPVNTHVAAADLIELWRGDLLESVHRGHAVIWGEGGIVEAWGDPDAIIYPRSSCKMLQALPLIESGAADAVGLQTEQLALSCASHNGAAIHTSSVGAWLDTLGLGESDLRCGSHMPQDRAESRRLICSDQKPCQLHNNCSGKHAGFLTLNRRLRGDADYHMIDHPVQQAVKAAFEEVTGETSPGHGIDGCSAPNFATSVSGLARAMAAFAAPKGGARGDAMVRLTQAMILHPDLVAGEGRACTELMRAMNGRAAVKTGAEAVFVAIIPERRMGVALKVVDGGTRGSEAAITALMIRLGLLDANDPVAQKLLTGPQKNWRGVEVAQLRRAKGFAR